MTTIGAKNPTKIYKTPTNLNALDDFAKRKLSKYVKLMSAKPKQIKITAIISHLCLSESIEKTNNKTINPRQGIKYKT